MDYRILILIIVNIVFYSRTFKFGYVSDDLASSRDGIRSLKNFYEFLIRGNCHFPIIEHIFMTIVHTAITCLIFTSFGSNDVSFAAATLFSFNPSNSQCSILLASRYYTLGALLMMLMWQFKPFALLIYAIGIFSGFCFNFILAPIIFIFAPYPLFALILPISIYYSVKHRKNAFFIDKITKHSNDYMRKITIGKFIFATRAFAYYFLHCVFPKRLGMYHVFHYSYGFNEDDIKKGEVFDKWFFAGFSIIVLTMVGVIFSRNPVYFGLFWFFILIIQWCQIIGIIQPFAERYVYLANVGLMYAVASYLSSLPFGSYLILALVIYYMTRLWLHMGAYKNNKLFLEYNVYDINYPDSFMAWLIKGEREVVEDFEGYKAADSFREGLKHTKTYPRLHFQLADLLSNMGYHQEALWHFRECIKFPMNYTGVTEDDFMIVEKRIKDGINKKENEKQIATV